MKINIYGALILGIGLVAGVVHAADVTWTGGGTSQTNWADGDNWSTGTEPVADAGNAGDILYFDTTNNYAIFDGYDANEQVTNRWPGQSYYRQIRVGYNADGRLDVVSGSLVGDSASVQHRVGVNGYTGTLNVLGGTLLSSASTTQFGLGLGGTGIANITGGTYIWGRESSGISGYLGADGNGCSGTINISGGTFQTRAGIVLGRTDGNSTGVLHVAGSSVTEVGIGSNGSVNGKWIQNTNGTLRVGIDSGGITPVLVDDVSADGPSGFATVTFEAGSSLEPYFIGGSQTGKWTVLTVDGAITDNGLALDNGGDTNWSYNVVSNYILEVWYGLGDSGYNPEPPSIVYTNGVTIWDGEAGDNAFDNPTNWAFAGNNVLPLQGNGSAGAILQFDTTTNYAVYTAAEGTRTYNRIHVGYDADGRLDVTGNGYTLKGDNNGSHYIGRAGHTGTLNIDGGGTLNLGASTGYVGADSGSTGIVNVVNNGRLIYGRESGGISAVIGNGGGNGTVNIIGNGRFLTRAGIQLGDGGTGIGLFSVQGAGGQIGIGSEGTVDGRWVQNSGSTLQALVSSSGLTTILVDDKDNDGTGGDVSFNTGSLLDVDFTGYAGENGSWDVMTWEGNLISSNLAWAAGVDSNAWSFAFVASGTNGIDTLRITATGFGPSVNPDITAFSVDGSTVSLSWDSELGSSYNVLSKADLTDPTWTTNVAAVPGAGATTSTNLTGSGAEEFYLIEAY